LNAAIEGSGVYGNDASATSDCNCPLRHIASRTIARGQGPGVGAVAREMPGISDRVCAIDQRCVAVVLEVGGRTTVVQAVRMIEAEIRVVRKKEWAARADTYIELNPVIGVPVCIMI